jgi:4-hydroxybenzoate polyprenyltransferase
MSRLSAYAQLVRLPNVFTALADICLGAWAAQVRKETPLSLHWWLSFTFVLAASASLYCSGMAWNDFFDVEQDGRERPFRPIPSGRISRRSAGVLAAVLMSAGLGFAFLSAITEEGFSWTGPVIAGLLAPAILLYDGWLKRTWAGPLGMGACRFCNVLLGLSVAGAVQERWEFHLAGVVGIYIMGITWFARFEAATSRKSALIAAAGALLGSLVLALGIPVWFARDTSSPLFPYLLAALGFWIGIPLISAIQRPRPALVQAAVKRSIMGLVVLDATLATALVGIQGLFILVLLFPALYLGRWIYST